MKNLPNLLLVSGNGRDSGKTSLVCNIIQRCSDHKITAIKISPHFHAPGPGLEMIVQNQHYTIAEEKSSLGNKDSSRMLKAGAYKVYYLQVKDDHLKEAFTKLLQIVPPSTPLICESGHLRSIIEPGVFILINREGRNTFKPNYINQSFLANLILTFNGSTFNKTAQLTPLLSHWFRPMEQG